jgi:transcriptional regulator with PAS, ATPase and Fis domain
MKTQVNKPETLSLYDRATAQLKKQKSEEYTVFSEIETQKIIHELQVHKIELEMQNEELKIAKEEAEKATQKYTDLYNFAPSGYMTLSKKGSIVELNFSAAMLLGNEIKYLTNKNFIDFLSPETRTLFSLFLNTLFIEKAKETCEVVLMVKNSLPVYAHVDGIVLGNNEQCYLTITDTTKEKVAENTIKESQRLRIIGEMASGIAHDFNNSLQVMLSSLNIVRLKSEFD